MADVARSAPAYNPRPENVHALLALVRVTQETTPRGNVLNVVGNRVFMAFRLKTIVPDQGRTPYEEVVALVTGMNGTENYRQMVEMLSFLAERGRVLVEPEFFDQMKA